MGTWGPGTFEDDIACDWIEDLYESDPVAFFTECLNLDGLDELEFLACIGVVCTSEMIHGLLGTPRPGLPEVVYLWLEEHQQMDARSFVPAAISGLRRVLHPSSEMHVRWEDNEEMYGTWVTQMNDLLNRLELAHIEKA